MAVPAMRDSDCEARNGCPSLAEQSFRASKRLSPRAGHPFRVSKWLLRSADQRFQLSGSVLTYDGRPFHVPDAAYGAAPTSVRSRAVAAAVGTVPAMYDDA